MLPIASIQNYFKQEAAVEKENCWKPEPSGKEQHTASKQL